jgi:hypothetical protein
VADPASVADFGEAAAAISGRVAGGPGEALSLALAAANRHPTGYILDTLATAYWANGAIEEAVATEKQAIIKDPPQQGYYLQQIEKFLNTQYE